MRYEIATAGSNGVDSTITVGTEQLAIDLLTNSLVLAGFGHHRAKQAAGFTLAKLSKLSAGSGETYLSEDKSYTITITVK